MLFRFVILTAALLAVLSPFARAQTDAAIDTSHSTLVLNDKQNIYDAQNYMFLTRDGGADLGLREVYMRHRNNLRGEHLPPGPVNFSFDPAPHWLVLDIVNDSHKNGWMLDFGALTNGRTGLASQILAMDGARGAMLLDTSADNNPKGHLVPLNLMPGQRMTLVLMITPSDHAPLVLAPRILDANALLEDSGLLYENRLEGTVLVLMAGAMIFFLGGMFLRRGAGFFPHVLFFLSQGLWFWLANGHVYAPIPGSADITGVALAAGGLMALAVTQSILAAQDNQNSDSMVLYICASFVVLAIMCFAFIVPENSPMRLVVAGGATILAYVVAAFKAFGVRKEMRWAGRAAGAAWLVMLASNILPYLSGFGVLPLSPALLQAAPVAMPLVCVLLVLSGTAYIRAGSVSLVREVLRQAQRAQAVNRLKASKETADQARLLRVIEREREIMEDLRTREAERTEEMRMAKITADEANRAKSAFLAVVSHEIRTPMTGIMGMVRLLLDTQMTREQKDYAQTIQDSGDAMLALLNDILDFSKIEGGGMDLEVIDFDLHRIVNSVAMLMNGHAGQRGIYLNIDIDSDTPRYLKGDPTRLRQVLLNLVGNAIKFTPRGGVTIRLRAGDAGKVPADNPNLLPITCSVEDTGIGISDEAQKNLFSPFAQADSSIARKFGGTGLGLAICKRLIEAMGSHIELSSVEGQGTTFTFTLLLPPGDPKAAEAEGRAGELAGIGNLAQPMDILVVDDNPVNRKVMEGLLARDGHRVTSVGGGKEALALLPAKPFQLIFMDIEMPEMNGLETMAHILASDDQRIKNTPVVALTGNVAEEDKARYKAAGMRDTVAKPIDPERLRNILVAHGQPAKPVILPEKKKAASAAVWELSDAELDEDTFTDSVEYTGTTRPDMPEPDMPEAAPEETVPEPAQPRATLNDHLFNLNSLASLRQSLGEHQLQEMMDGVFAHNKTVLPTLQTAFNDGDTETLRGCAHELKGMNGNFGLRALAEISEKIERACRDGNVAFNTLDEIVFNELPEAMAATEKAFKGQ